ncbi:hypothetical protein ACFL6U_30035 [Planctomycetota bacterium]
MIDQQQQTSLLGDPLAPAWQDLDQAQGIRWDRWMCIFVSLAVLTRSVRYVLRFPLWDDESFLCISFYRCGFGELLEPLVRHQVAPFLFLWLEKAMVVLFGFNELSLRLVPFLVSIASVFLFAQLVRRLLAGPTRIFCMAWFAVSYPGIRYAAEAKQYGTDMFASLVLIVLIVEWLRRPGHLKWLIAAILWCPVAICLSLPAVFTAASMSLLVLIAMIRAPQTRRWGTWLTFNLVFVGGMAVVYVVSIRPQMQAELGFMGEYWDSSFVPFHSLWALARWLVETHTGILFAHPMGDNNYGSSLTTILCVVGIVFFLRQKRVLSALLLLLPLAMHLTAAALRKYPYGGHFKFSMYIAPMIYLVMGTGCAMLVGIRSTKKTSVQFARTVTVVLILIGSIGVGSIVRDILNPYKTTADLRQRALARWLWHDGNFEGRTVCIYDDLGVSFSERTWEALGWAAMYQCNKYIYAPRHMVREPRPVYAPIPETRILRCVLYRDMGCGDFQQEALDQWLSQMKQKYEYLGMESYPLPRHDKRNRYLKTIDYIIIYKFILLDDDV